MIKDAVLGVNPRLEIKGGVVTWPRCTTRKQYIVWLEAASLADGRPHSGFCTDCTAQYQSAKILAGQCDHPGVLFWGGEGHIPSSSWEE